MPPEESKPDASGGATPPDRDRDLIDAAKRQATPREGQSVPEVGSGWSGTHNGEEALPSDLFAGYQLLREIHRGGQGVVYQAIHKATKKKVAIKVMREGPFASPKDRIRFEREVDILSSLNHPNIVAIHDSGTAGGMFFYVMDYVSGRSLDAWIVESKRTIEETINLFTKVCDAVNAAHLKGVIHRDLKPSNIRIDSAGEPRILDFGLAKLATGSVTGESVPQVMTITGQFVGSLPWASPEQAEGDIAKIDVRTDVYSLGVMLYHALTGRFPYEVVGNMRDVLENILRASPARPSSIRRKINDEVETIVLKCLSKERDRRYQSAGELGRDLRHYLSGEPVEAKRDSGLYVVRKLVSRHRGTVGAASAVLIVIAGASIFSTVMWQREADARKRAQLAEHERTREADRAGLYADFLDRALTSVDPDTAQGNPGVMTDVLVRAGEDAQARLGSRPDVMGAVRDTIGRVYLKLGHYDEAERQIAAALQARRAAGSEPEIARTLASTGAVLIVQGEHRDAEDRLREALAIQKRIAAPATDTARTLALLGQALKEQSKRAEAEQTFRDAIAAINSAPAPDADALAEASNNLGQLYYEGREYSKAIPLFQQAIAARTKASPGEDRTQVAIDKSNLASALRDQAGPGDLDQAEKLLREAMAVYAKLLDPDHPLISVALNKLGLVYYSRRDCAQAEKLYRQSIDMRIRRSGAGHRLVGVGFFNLAQALQCQGRINEAVSAAEQCLSVYRGAGVEREKPQDYDKCLLLLISLDRSAKNLARAEERAREMVTRLKGAGADRESSAADATLMLAQVLVEKGDSAGAEPPAREALAFFEAKVSPAGYMTGVAKGTLGAALTGLARYDEAEQLVVSSAEIIEKSRGPAHEATLAAYDRAIALYKAWGKPGKEAEWAARRSSAAGK